MPTSSSSRQDLPPPASGAGMKWAWVQQTEQLWQQIHDIPLVRQWKILNDSIFLLISFVIGLGYFIGFVVMASLGFSLLVLGIGVVILAALAALSIAVAQIERLRIRVFLGVDIPWPYRALDLQGNKLAQGWKILKTPFVWRDIAYLLLLFPVGILELVLVLFPWPYLLAPVVTLFGGTTVANGWVISNFGEGIVAGIVGLILAVPVAIGINFVARLHGQMGQWLLSPTSEEVLTGRVEELTESRSAVMRAMHLERRRIERDLHDGAQQRLVALAMELGLAREKMETDVDAARQLLDEAHEDAKATLAELRDLVRGIHPAVLTDRGLDAAISAIAGRSPVPVAVNVALDRRQPDEVEGTAYFVVVEALTNIARHSGATRADVSIRRESGWLKITVSDNGRGGADPVKGSGLRGLKDRIEALDGRFRLTSPAGKGTVLEVEIPCA